MDLLAGVAGQRCVGQRDVFRNLEPGQRDSQMFAEAVRGQCSVRLRVAYHCQLLTHGVVSDAEHGDLLDRRVSVGHVLYFDGGDVFAAPDDDLLDPAGDVEEPIIVEVTEIACAKPAVNGKRLAGHIVALPVAGCDGDTAQLNLAVLGRR